MGVSLGSHQAILRRSQTHDVKDSLDLWEDLYNKISRMQIPLALVSSFASLGVVYISWKNKTLDQNYWRLLAGLNLFPFLLTVGYIGPNINKPLMNLNKKKVLTPEDEEHAKNLLDQWNIFHSLRTLASTAQLAILSLSYQ